LTFDAAADWEAKDVDFQNALSVKLTGANESDCPIFYNLTIWDVDSSEYKPALEMLDTFSQEVAD
jgi:hypothetical protein